MRLQETQSNSGQNKVSHGYLDTIALTKELLSRTMDHTKPENIIATAKRLGHEIHTADAIMLSYMNNPRFIKGSKVNN
ncbi:MAG: hypothetical protein PHS92_03315 [Candidatus Gracilibacteria bacterium]|nr:hypothetical protein [Candidatus Gracilibacteria bacterium]